VLLVSWNVAGRVRDLPEQAERVASLQADVVCLQEVTPSTLSLWEAHLAEAGYGHIEHARPDPEESRRPLMVLTAATAPLALVHVPALPWPERVLAVQLAGATEVLNVHSPTSPKPERAKLETHLAVHRHLARPGATPRILCGDLNTPRKEHPDGTVWSFARDRYGRLIPERGEEWEAAELSLLRGLERYGFVDAYRALHGYDIREISWGFRRWSGGYRLDHLLLDGIEAVACTYEHRWREEGLSDHSALLARLRAPIDS
jgi:exonuclease III